MKNSILFLNATPLSSWLRIVEEAEYRAPALAKVLNVSERTLQRSFKRELRISPQAWLDRLRDKIAEELLLQGERTKEIAYRLHFLSPSDFCHRFKSIHGVSPKAWRTGNQDGCGPFRQTKHSGIRTQTVGNRQSIDVAVPHFAEYMR